VSRRHWNDWTIGTTNMNAAQHNFTTGSTALDNDAVAPADPGSQWSALLDGEVAAHEVDALLRSLAEDDALRGTCQRYALIGDALRGGTTRDADCSPHAFVAGVRARLAAETLTVMPALQPVQSTPQVRAPAANDAVFRWKLLAGVASLAAVMAVSWSVIDAVPASGAAAGAQMALLPANGAVAVSAAVPARAETAVLVQTPRGPVLRDARLEQLLAEHRQYGGMSALQMPAGFLRDATQQTDPQR
jgi:sigma-E factor negative regulatory protein RseA